MTAANIARVVEQGPVEIAGASVVCQEGRLCAILIDCVTKRVAVETYSNGMAGVGGPRIYLAPTPDSRHLWAGWTQEPLAATRPPWTEIELVGYDGWDVWATSGYGRYGINVVLIRNVPSGTLRTAQYTCANA